MMWFVWIVACQPAPAPTEDWVFVRGGLIGPVGEGARPIGGGRALWDVDWAPGGAVGVAGRSLVAPRAPECVPLFSVDLGDVTRPTAQGAEPPDTAVAFSPDGGRLAVGTATGRVLILDAWTGQTLAERVIPEALVKQVLWSPDGQTLFVGEQAVEAAVRALDATTLSDRWVRSLTPDLGASPPPDGDDLYGVYQLPGVFGLGWTGGGDLWVSGVHGWLDGSVRRNASRLYRIDPRGGEIVAAWPPDGPLDGTLMWPRVAPAGDALIVPVGRTADGPTPPGVPVGCAARLEIPALSVASAYCVAPLRPWFDGVFSWEGVDIDPAADRAVMGLGDGRLVEWTMAGDVVATHDLGTPITSAGVPISAPAGFIRVTGGGVFAVTSGTSIPYGSADPSLRPPRAHPRENRLWRFPIGGGEPWSVQPPHRLQGLSVSPDGQRVVVGGGVRESDAREDLFGALVYRVGGGDAPEVTCPTAGPVHFRHAVLDDGRIAVVEHPYRAGDAVRGAYQVTVLR